MQRTRGHLESTEVTKPEGDEPDDLAKLDTNTLIYTGSMLK